MNDKDKPFKHIVIVGCGDIGLVLPKSGKIGENLYLERLEVKTA